MPVNHHIHSRESALVSKFDENHIAASHNFEVHHLHRPKNDSGNTVDPRNSNQSSSKYDVEVRRRFEAPHQRLLRLIKEDDQTGRVLKTGIVEGLLRANASSVGESTRYKDADRMRTGANLKVKRRTRIRIT